MAVSINLANRALILCGVTQLLTSINSDQIEATIINNVYDDIVEEVISQHTFSSTVFRQKLSLLATTPSFDYTYEFSLPSNPYCYRIIRLYNSGEKFIEHKREAQKILTKTNTAYIQYVGRVEEEGQMDSFLKSMIVLRLAVEICLAVSGNSQLQDKLEQKYNNLSKKLKALDALQDSGEYIKYNEEDLDFNNSYTRTIPNGS